MRNLQNYSILHPLLFGIIPIFLIYSKSIGFIEPTEIFLPLISIPVIIFSIWIFLDKVIGNKTKTSLILSLGIVLFFSYSQTYDFFDDFSIGGSYLKNQYLLLVFVLLFSIGVIFIIKSKLRLTRVTTSLNVITIVLILVSLTNIGLVEYEQSETNALTDSIASQNLERKGSPDIYYIILDSYAHPSIMNKVYGYDNSQFLEFLKERGFYISSNSHTNYRHGFLSLSSSLNMEYVNFFADELGKYSRDFQRIYEIVEDNKVMGILKSKGYKIINFASNNGLTGNSEIADINLCEKNEYFDSQFMIMLIKETMLRPFYIIFFDSFNNDRTWCVFSELSSIHEKNSQPLFVFAHLLIPHSPFRFDENGNSIPYLPPETILEESEHKRGYSNQAKFLDKKIMEVVDNILKNSNNQPIIIIQSDVGTSLQSKIQTETVERKMKILNAYYLPDDGNSLLYDSITPVNSFRIVFNHYFNGDYDLLEDRIYFSEYYSELNFTEITDQLIGN